MVVASASGVADPPTIEVTNAVVAICVVLVPAAAVGAVGVPVNEGEAMVALNAISFVFTVILDVLAVTLFSKEVILVVFAAILVVLVTMFAVLAVMLEVFAATFVCKEVILDVFVAILFVLVAMFEEFVAMLFVFAVILAVFAFTLVCNEVIFAEFVATVDGKLAMVAELTPPTLFTVGDAAVPPKSLAS